MHFNTVLAIDFGTKRIGLAIARSQIAEPFTIISNKQIPNSKQNQNYKFTISKIKEICDQKHVDKIVVGLSENEMAEKTKEFVQELKKYIDLPIEFFDETLSSQEVEHKLRSQSIKKSKRSGPIDHYAAAVILQNYLDSN